MKQPPVITLTSPPPTKAERQRLGLPVSGGKPNPGTKKDKRLRRNRKKK